MAPKLLSAGQSSAQQSSIQQSSLSQSAVTSAMAMPSAGQKPVALSRYVDPLPVPPVLRPSVHGGNLEIQMREFGHKAHRDLPPTSMWGYNGMWPGPTLEVRRGQPLEVKWTNALPTKHFLPIDHTIHGADESLPDVRAVVHVHGAQVLPESDGYPEAWSTSDGKTGPAASASPSHYPNGQPAAMLWYHDHCLGITRLNVYAGLAGLYRHPRSGRRCAESAERALRNSAADSRSVVRS